jgi:cell division initiation protein
MTPSDLDLPLLPSADQIKRREFATVRRGYDPDQVRDYLQQVALQVETLEKGVREARMEAEHRAARTTGPIAPIAEPAPTGAIAAPPSDETYEALAKRFAGVIAGADREATKVLDEAKEEATRVLEQARAEADRIRVDAQARAEEARQRGSEELAKAKEEADRILGSLAERRETLVNQMQDMQSKLLNVAQGLTIAFDDGEHEAVNATEPDASMTEPEGSDDTTPSKATTFDDDLVDPRYEDLWVSTETQTVDIPDLATIDIDFDDETRDRD